MLSWMRWVARATTAWWLVMGAVLLASGLLPQREYSCNDVFIVETSLSTNASCVASRHVVRMLVRIAAVPFVLFGVASAIIGAVAQAVGLALFGLGLLGVALTLIAASRSASRAVQPAEASVHS